MGVNARIPFELRKVETIMNVFGCSSCRLVASAVIKCQCVSVFVEVYDMIFLEIPPTSKTLG